jgi:uncharacterized damage-inducible protein DinB
VSSESAALDQLRRLWRHSVWADAQLLEALRKSSVPSVAALHEYAHVLAAEEVWLARLEGRSPRVEVWPTLALNEAASLSDQVRDGFDRFLSQLNDAQLGTPVGYVNSAGQAFMTPIADIVLHVALHGQYHRGKVNLLLRQAGEPMAPTDYIAFVRGVPAARS